MTMRWSAVRAISDIRWLETRTVRPSAARDCRRRRTQRIPFGVEPVDRLVEDQYGGISEERGGDAESLAHAQGQLAGPAVGRVGQADDAENLVDAGPGISLESASQIRWLRAVLPGCRALASRSAPTWRSGNRNWP